MPAHLPSRSIAASRRELDAKLELLQQLGYDADNRFCSDEDDHVAPLSEKSAYLDHDTDRWIQTEYNWALQEAADAVIGIPDLFDVEEEDEEACLPYVYDPTFFGARPSAPSTPRTRSQSLTQPMRSDYDKPLPVPPLRLRTRPSLPLVPPPTPAKSYFASPISSSPRSLLSERKQTPPPSPRLSSRLSSSPKPRPFPRSHTPSLSSSQPARPSTQRHATFPSISSTMSMLEERETETEKRSAVYVADEEVPPRASPRPTGRGRSSSAALPRTADEFGPAPHTISSSPRRKQRPTLPTLTTSHSTPQLRNLAELATMPSPSLAPAPTLLPSLMSDATASAESEVVSPGEAITCSPFDSPADEEAEAALASRWSLDSVASRPRIRHVPVDVTSASPASKATKRDRLLSLISGRPRAGSGGKPSPPPNTPRGSSDVLDIRRSSSRETMHTPSRPSFSMSVLPPRALAPSVSSSSSSGGSTASTLATPIEPTSHSPLPDMDPFGTGAPSCMFEDEPVFAANPFLPQDDSPPPSPPRVSLTLQIPSRPTTPNSPPPQPTLPLPSPSTPSPSFLVPTPRSQSFFASLKGRPRRRRKKLVISGAPLERDFSRASSALEASEDAGHRAAERERRVENVIRWCEHFGPTRKIERKEDGSLHVYWKDWEVADTVCRIQAQVVIKDVGRVNLAWSYIS